MNYIEVSPPNTVCVTTQKERPIHHSPKLHHFPYTTAKLKKSRLKCENKYDQN